MSTKQTANDGVEFEQDPPASPGVYLAARSLNGPRFLIFVARVQGALWGQLMDGESQAQKFPEKNRGTAFAGDRFRNLLWAKAN